MYPAIRRFAKSKTRPIDCPLRRRRTRSHRSQSRPCDYSKGTSPRVVFADRLLISAVTEYEGIWEMFVQMHRETQGENQATTRDLCLCCELAVLLEWRCVSPAVSHCLDSILV